MDERNGMAEIYIKLLKMVRGKGYGADSVNALVRYAFCELQLNCIRANILENNMNRTCNRTLDRIIETISFPI